MVSNDGANSNVKLDISDAIQVSVVGDALFFMHINGTLNLIFQCLFLVC